MIYLVDQDGVLADFSGHFHTLWGETRPDAPNIPVSQRKHFFVHDDLPERYKKDIRKLIRRQNFFRDMPPIPDALVGINELLETGAEVFILTSPVSDNPYCHDEKVAWVQHHLGPDFVRRLIIGQDKTMVRGDYLIDDKPEITGIYQPLWKHVVYDAPYNKDSLSQLRMNWQNWKTVLPLEPEQDLAEA